MHTDILIQLADRIQSDKNFEMSAGQNEHGMLGHLKAMMFASWQSDFRSRVCSVLHISASDYSEMFYPSGHDVNWKASTTKAEKGHVTAEFASKFLRTVAMLYEESVWEVPCKREAGSAVGELKYFPVNIEEGNFTPAVFRTLWSMARYRRNIDAGIIHQVLVRLETDILKLKKNPKTKTILNQPFTLGYHGEVPSVPMALAEYFLAEIGWPEAPSVNAKLNVISDATRLPISELRRIFATRYDMDGYSYSARRDNNIAYISPQHAFYMLDLLGRTGEISWRVAKQIEDSQTPWW